MSEPLDLDAIELELNDAEKGYVSTADVRALIAEVRRLRATTEAQAIERKPSDDPSVFNAGIAVWPPEVTRKGWPYAYTVEDLPHG
jgi:hypothetical protein